ncbi:MAG: DUF58 domain-containing protein, partial [Algoriella sp.]
MKFFTSIFFSNRFFYAGFFVAFIFVMGFFMQPILYVAKILLFAYIIVTILDFFLIYLPKKSVFITRNYPERFSNGDDNKMQLLVENKYQFPLYIRVIDEFPVQLQLRKLQFKNHFKSSQKKQYDFTVKPTERGA